MAEIRDSIRQSLRFGSFDLDLQTGELRKAGVLVSLQEQSLRVLLALLERPGELVSREQLHQRVWPDGTFVDFDHGLNAVINRLRDTLGDSADTPRLIETLPRRGYRFIGSIDRLDRGGASERSAPVSVAPRVYDFGRFRLDAAERLLLRDSHPVTLTPKAFDLLVYLVERPGRLVGKSTLMSELWPDTIVEEANLAFQISALRKVLDEDRDSESIIQTVPTRGYRFVGDVTRAIPPLKEEATDTKASVERTRRYNGVVWPAVALTLAISLALGLYLYRWFRPVPPGAMRTIPLTTLPGNERDPSFSPDGDRIAFAWTGEKGDNEDIYVKVVGTERPFQLTTNPAAEQYPAWSPDGRRIAFFRASAVGSELVVIPALGGAERTILSRSSSLKDCNCMSWSPDGQLLAIADREADKTVCKIFLLSLETLQKRQLTSPPEGHYGSGDYAPVFSPDGRTVAFNRQTSEGAGIHVVPAGGGDVTRVTTEEYGLRHRLAWVPSGRELLFSSSGGDPEIGSSLWRVPASGGTPERLGIGGGDASNPTVSMRGNRLAYERQLHDANTWKIALPQSTRPTPAPSRLNPSSRSDFSPHVSPDGARIAFLSDRSGTDEIWLSDTDGSNLVQLTSSAGLLIGSPRWSPDGRQLAFEGRVKGRAGIFVINAEGGLPREVTPDPSVAVLASWSSDGRWIYFGSNRTGRAEVWKVPAKGGQAVQVTKRGGFRAFESADGTFVYYSHRFGSGLWKVPVNGGEETEVLDFPAHLWGYWAVVNDGIYFVDDKVSPRPALKFFAFGTGRVSQVMSLEEKPIPFWPGLAISPDGKWLLYTQFDSSSGDLMLVENFH
jgi:Tol biopolymer transport system component/DNA-binding winged helix-turn-helix (wHTH) protein